MTTVQVGTRQLQLTYSTNVHPGRDLDEVTAGLERHALAVKRLVSPAEPFGVGLWLGARTVDLLAREEDSRRRLEEFLAANDLYVTTLNAFPFGDFHADRVKEEVYRPSWADPRRRSYTEKAARILARLLPEGLTGSVSTLAGGAKADGDDPAARSAMARELLAADRALAEIESETGRRIVLALEPEPGTTLESSRDVVAFFSEYVPGTTHLGVCLDICHQAVVYESVLEALGRLRAADVEIAKIQVSSAIEVVRPGQNAPAREALAELLGDRYLHQTYAFFANGRVESVSDLDGAVPEARASWLSALSWRTHFHVPVFATELGPLGTTRRELETALAGVAVDEDLAPHLEIETYTWGSLPRSAASGFAGNLAEGIAREFAWVREFFSRAT